MTTVFTTNNNNINAGTGSISCGSINCGNPIKYYDFELINGSSNYFNSVNSSYDLIYVQGTGSSTTFTRYVTTGAFGSYTLKQTSGALIGTAAASYYYSSITFSSSRGFTISLWVRLPSDTTTRFPLVLANSNISELFALSIGSNVSGTILGINLYLINNDLSINKNILYQGITINANSWNNIVVTVSMPSSTTVVQTFVNGALANIFGTARTTFNYAGINTGSNNNNTSGTGTVFTTIYKLYTGTSYNLYLGGVPTTITGTNYYNFTGDIDGVTVYDRNVSSTCIGDISCIGNIYCTGGIYVGNDVVISSDDNVYINTNGKFFVNGGMVVEKTNAFVNEKLADYGLGTGYRVINRDKTDAEQGTLFANDASANKFPDASYSLVCKGRIACQNEIGVFSDVRIKNNINNIDSIRSLELLRRLQPKTFNYIDDDKNHKLSYGFIAQEVDNVFSDSISKNREVVPNVYSCCSVIQNVFTFKDYSITDLSQNDSIKIIN